MPEATLAERREAADVWNREKPWFTKVSKRWSGSLRAGVKNVDVYWHWDWYKQFTFMLDASMQYTTLHRASKWLPLFQPVRELCCSSWASPPRCAFLERCYACHTRALAV